MEGKFVRLAKMEKLDRTSELDYRQKKFHGKPKVSGGGAPMDSLRGATVKYKNTPLRRKAMFRFL